MNKPDLRSIFVLLALFFPLMLFAQDSENTFKSYDRLYLENSWLYSGNSAGSVFNSFIPDGVFTLNTGFQKSDLNLSQLSPEEREYGFSARKTVRLDKVVFDGGVEYINQQQKSVGWTSRMDPLTSNPYMLGDSMQGLYSKDYVNLFGSIGYQMTDRIAIGVNADYLVGDGARIKDPRPVNDLFSLDIYPSILFNFSDFKIGANLHLIKGREEISYSVLENLTSYQIFRLFGLGIANSVNTSHYYRNYYNSGIGGELQTEYKIGNVELFTGLGYLRKKELSEDQSRIPKKYSSGDYIETDYHFYTIFRIKKDLIHFAELFTNFSTGEGIEYAQKPYPLEGTTYFRTVTEYSKYSVFNLNPGFRYTLVKPYHDYLNKWKLEAGIEMEHVYNKYVLEADQTITNLIPSLNYNYAVFHQKDQWNFGIQLMYNLNLNKELKRLRPFAKKQTKVVWENITYPDHLILTANSFAIGPSIRYGKEIKLLKEKNSHVFVDLSGMYRNATNETWNNNKTMKFLRLKIGITY